MEMKTLTQQAVGAILVAVTTASFALGQENSSPPQLDLRLYDIVSAASPERIDTDIRKLVSFGTRNTFSDTVSQTRGIGAARRWIVKVQVCYDARC